jgi:hypothetical protein
MPTHNNVDFLAELARRTCATCACFARIGPDGLVKERNSQHQPSCMLGPPMTQRARISIPVTDPVSGHTLMQRDKETDQMVPRMTEQEGYRMVWPLTIPESRCWYWRPIHVLPGDTHWLPPARGGVLAPDSSLGLPPPAGDLPRGT